LQQSQKILSLLLHTHIPDTSAESLLQINLYFKPVVEWNMKAQSSVQGISCISDMPSTEFIQLLFAKNIFFFFPDNKTGTGTKHSPEKDEHLQHLLQSGFKFHLQVLGLDPAVLPAVSIWQPTQMVGVLTLNSPIICKKFCNAVLFNPFLLNKAASHS